MHKGHTISVVIPCYNEEDGIGVTLADMPDVVDEVMVVDNNCTDRTAEIATAMGAKVVCEPKPGYGAAYKAGFLAATGDIIVTMDGDATYPRAFIPVLLDVLIDEVGVISASAKPRITPVYAALNVHLTPDSRADLYVGPIVAYVVYSSFELVTDPSRRLPIAPRGWHGISSGKPVLPGPRSPTGGEGSGSCPARYGTPWRARRNGGDRRPTTRTALG